MVAWLALVPGPRFSAAFSAWSDKIEHGCAFAVLSLGYLCLWRIRALHAFVALLLYGAGIELAQLALPSRQASIVDLLADGSGVLVGFVVCRIASKCSGFCSAWLLRGKKKAADVAG